MNILKRFFKKKSKAKKVLIVEDDALLSKVLSEHLVNENFEVALAENGLRVAGAVKDFLPDMILLDLIIPGIDGFAVLKQLKENEKSKNIPVLVLSNLGDVGDVKSAKALGAEGYFIKSNTEMDKIVKYIKNRLG
jgi:DNA-binding response OmpR family regulator